MKIGLFAFKLLSGIFLCICIWVHVQGLWYHTGSEPVWSHIVHGISYCFCLFTVFKTMKYRLLLYYAGMLYPFLFHARCLLMYYSLHNEINSICLLVVIAMPFTAFIIWLDSQQ